MSCPQFNPIACYKHFRPFIYFNKTIHFICFLSRLEPAAPNFLQRIKFPLTGYVHNAWMTADSDCLMSTEETDGKTVKLWDIRDLDNISISDDYLGPNGLAHNAHIKGNYA